MILTLYLTNVKVDTRIFFCYISVVLTEHMLKNLHVLYSFKAVHIINSTMIYGKNDSSLQEVSIITL